MSSQRLLIVAIAIVCLGRISSQQVTPGPPGLYTCPQPTGLFPAPNCGQFYQCADGRYYLKDCPSTLYFNPTIQVCDWPQNVNCKAGTPTTPVFSTCPRPTGRFAGPSCSQFYDCLDGRYYLRDCPTDLYFNLDTQCCDWPQNVNCAWSGSTSRGPISTVIPSSGPVPTVTPGPAGFYTCPQPTGLFPAPNCNQFYQCADGRYYLKDCPSTLYFNPAIQVCDWPKNVNCTNGGKPIPGLYTCPRPTGRFAGPSCSQFYDCLDGRNYLRDCSKDLYFNPNTQCCDWPQRVNCTGSGSTSGGPVPATMQLNIIAMILTSFASTMCIMM